MSTSAGNAGQLCGPFCLPFGSPGFLPDFFKRAVSRSSGVGFNILDVARNVPWLLEFARNCSRGNHVTNSAAMLQLAHESVAALEALMLRHDIDFGYRRNCGKLYLYDSLRALTSETQLIALRREIGYDVQTLDKNECLKIEPLLNRSKFDFAGGIYAPESSVGDCALFTRRLARSLQEKGVDFKYRSQARNIVYRQGKVQAVHTEDAVIDADIVVLSTAVHIKELLPRALRSKYLVAPLKGYSLTLPMHNKGPQGTITDAKRAAAFSVLGNRLRITGGAYLSSSTSVPAQEVQRLLEIGKSWFPGLARYDIEADEGWAGLRPVTPRSVPYIGNTSVAGLMLNTGHGGFGWTCAAASAQRLLSHLEGR